MPAVDDPRIIQRSLTTLRDQAARRDNAGRPVGPAFASAARTLAKDERRLGSAGEAWNATCPSSLLPRTALLGLLRGELRIAVADSATMYELDRHLRGGGESALARASTAPVHRVRLVLDARPFLAGEES